VSLALSTDYPNLPSRCFYINLPIGAVTLIVMTVFFKTPSGIVRGESLPFRERLRKLDPLGTMIFVPAVVCLLLALQWGGAKYAWNSSRIILLLAIFGVCVLVFIFIQIRDPENATISPRILTRRSILAGAWYSFFAGAGYYVLVYFVCGILIPLCFSSDSGSRSFQYIFRRSRASPPSSQERTTLR
jgi:MFS family permease